MPNQKSQKKKFKRQFEKHLKSRLREQALDQLIEQCNESASSTRASPSSTQAVPVYGTECHPPSAYAYTGDISVLSDEVDEREHPCVEHFGSHSRLSETGSDYEVTNCAVHEVDKIKEALGSTSEAGDENSCDDTNVLLVDTATSVPSFDSELATWALQHNISHSALDDLMNLLRKYNHHELPKSSKTLLHTPRCTTPFVKDVGKGKFWYHGILNAVKPYLTPSYLENEVSNHEIHIDIFTDGISPYKSSQKAQLSVWPIAGRLCVKNTKPFVIALWCGESKDPGDVHAFFSDFVAESEEMMAGFKFNGQIYKLKIRNCIADAPARAWVKQVKQHGNTICCERCHIKGHWMQRIIYDPHEKATLRTDESFKNRDQAEYHIGTSPLQNIMGMISQFPLDRLHLIDLGAMKRVLMMLLQPKASSIKLKGTVRNELNEYIKLLSPFFPTEFARKPRSWDQWKKFKGADYRRMLHYDGFLIFKKLSEINSDYKDVFTCFLLLACAIRILSDSKMVKDYLKDADYLLNVFVQYSCQVFGPTFVVYNIHHLTHIAQDCKLHGPLDEFSAYVYESNLGHLKQMLRSPGRALPQLIARIIEKESVLPTSEEPLHDTVTYHKPHSCGPVHGLSGEQYRKFKCKDFMIRIMSCNDACLLTKQGNIVIIVNILKCEDGVYFVGRDFEKKTSFFKYPFPSSKLEIFEVKVLGSLCIYKLDEVKTKCVLLPKFSDHHELLDDNFVGVCLPMMHVDM